MKYIDFVDLKYKPSETDLICTFHVEPEGISLKEAAGGVAAESSIGTWTELTTEKPYVERLAAHVFSIDGNSLLNSRSRIWWTGARVAVLMP